MQNPSLNPAILLTPAEDSYLAYDPTADRLHTLNPVAALITELCDGTRSVEQIRQIVAPLLSEGQAAEIDRWIQQAVEAGLLVYNGNSGTAHCELTAKELFELAHRLEDAGKGQTALICERRVTELAPDNANGWYYRGELAEMMGRRDEERTSYEKYLELKPDDEEIRHLLVALRGEAPPARMSDKCILQIYDGFADTFDARLLQDLGYKGPERVRDLVAPLLAARPDQAAADHSQVPQPDQSRPISAAVSPNWSSDQDDHPERAERFARDPSSLPARPPYRRNGGEGSAVTPAGQPRPTLAVLDLGCGTGLASPQFKPYAARLVGVDLSPEMLALARKRDLYDRLDAAEITAWLDANTERFDLALACDCLIYFGDLQPVTSGVARLLNPGGVFAFTTERGDRYPSHLNDSGRFEHHPDYVREVAARASLEVARLEEGFLRTEYGKDVIGLFVALAKPAAV